MPCLPPHLLAYAAWASAPAAFVLAPAHTVCCSGLRARSFGARHRSHLLSPRSLASAARASAPVLARGEAAAPPPLTPAAHARRRLRRGLRARRSRRDGSGCAREAWGGQVWRRRERGNGEGAQGQSDGERQAQAEEIDLDSQALFGCDG
ncbi:hypothetical protein PVAP13_6NG066900 [Panicum virgatum]|uniref:Uncharacterized protein n=1 Tax=Panicum virgatum TaxID=38727 RepID=A0A8T0QVE9_PANVG|nr:hypothetical protein PVAP13_6NG066900 [Panicum virgatum]